MAEADPAPIVADNIAAPTRRRSALRPVLLIGIPLTVAVIAGYFWLMSGQFISTDNAYVQQDKVSVAADVAGRIVEVAVKENQQVRAGDLLFRIDPAPYRIAVEQADAAIAAAQVNVATLQSTYRNTGADIAAARDRIVAAEQDVGRQAALMKQGFTTRARLEQAEHGLEQARAALANAQGTADEARAKLETGAAVPGVNPALAAARVQREKALLDLARTAVYAPKSGIISQSDRLQIGETLLTGLAALSIVAGDTTWVECNFKETDLDKMHIGQPATVSFDAYPGLKLKGHVESIGAGTGSEFSVLPAQNATGNWVKVTQRVPVKVVIEGKSPRRLLAGLSARVTVDVRDHGRR